MLRLPARREKVRSGILRGPKLVWPRHDAFIRRHTCIVTLSKLHDDCRGPICSCHYRTAANSGTAIKPASWWTWPGCDRHHTEQHTIGQDAFEKKYGLDLSELCREFARLSTDQAMKDAMREAGLL